MTSIHSSYDDNQYLHSFPTRRSSDLAADAQPVQKLGALHDGDHVMAVTRQDLIDFVVQESRLLDAKRYEEWNALFTDDALDRKSTRLNSSHGYISYAVFCLKKKRN